MRTLFDGEFAVAYGQLYVDGRADPDETPDLDECFTGQRQGLCGAAVSGYLFLMTGTHTGHVPLTVEAHDTEPAVDLDAWEDVVEAWFRVESADPRLSEWDGDGHDLALAPGEYRVRYLCRGMDAADGGDRWEDEPALDEYLLQLWPAPACPDRIVKATSQAADHWHRFVAEPRPPTAQELAEARRLALEKERQRREREELAKWGGRVPSDRLRSLGGRASKLAYRDAALVHAIDDAGPRVQRAIARWAAHRFCDVTGLSGVDWIAGGLAELDRGEPFSPPLDDVERTWERLGTDPRVRALLGRSLDRAPEAARRSMPFPALTDAAHPDPLRAALDALAAAMVIHGRGRDLLAEVREAFPSLAHAPLPQADPRRSAAQIRMVAVRRRPE